MFISRFGLQGLDNLAAFCLIALVDMGDVLAPISEDRFVIGDGARIVCGPFRILRGDRLKKEVKEHPPKRFLSGSALMDNLVTICSEICSEIQKMPLW